MDKIRVAIVDDQQLFRKAVAGILSGIEEFELIADSDSGESFLAVLQQAAQIPDIVLVDLEMPGMNGMELNEQLHRLYPSVKTIILTVFNQERFISRMIDEGANGYLAKNCDMEELVAAIIAVHKTGFYLNAECISALRNAHLYRNKKMTNINNVYMELTAREQEVLLLICKEYTNVEIGEELFISARTVEGHRNNLLAKTGCRNTAGLAVFAISRGLYKPWIA